MTESKHTNEKTINQCLYDWVKRQSESKARDSAEQLVFVSCNNLVFCPYCEGRTLFSGERRKPLELGL